MSNPTRQIVAPAVALTLLFCSGPVHANSPEIEALEARVAALEALVSELLNETTEPAPKVAPAQSGQATPGNYKIGGYIKLDAMFSDYSGGDLSPGSKGSQFYVPAMIPVGGTPGEGPDIDLQARETRINFASDHVLGNGHRLGTFVEMDFFLGSSGNERISNSYNPRLRHAFFNYDNWLVGQTWSTFQDAGALPENLDFIGPAEGTTFVRQAQVRYANDDWEFAIENPETTITPFGGGSRIVADDGSLPDFVARYTARLDKGYIKAAGLLRQLNYRSGGISDREAAYGLSLSGKHEVGDDDIRWMATAGNGTGRYLGLNTSNGAVLDSRGNLNAIEQWGGFVSVRHFWDAQWRSNITLSYLHSENDTGLTGTDVTKDVYSAHVNLLYQPLEKILVGGEVMFAERTLESDASGDMTRLLFSAKYVF